MSKLTDYAVMQKTVYDLYSGDRAQAEAMVAPNYDQARAQAMQVTAHILDNYRSRANWNVDLSELTLLDVGCGVGRVMECFVEHGVGSIDGADVSTAMLKKLQPPTGQAARFDDDSLRLGTIRTKEGVTYALLNWDDQPREMTISLDVPHRVRELWTDADLGTRNGTWTTTLPPHSGRVVITSRS